MRIKEKIKKSFLPILSPPFLLKLGSTQQIKCSRQDYRVERSRKQIEKIQNLKHKFLAFLFSYIDKMV